MRVELLERIVHGVQDINEPFGVRSHSGPLEKRLVIQAPDGKHFFKRDFFDRSPGLTQKGRPQKDRREDR